MLNPSGPSDEPFINTYLTTESDEPILLKNTVITLETLSQVQNTILFIADGKGLDENGNPLQTDPSLALQGVPNNIRIFTIPISETLTAPERIDRNFLAQIAQAGYGESFELSQLAGKWANIQTGLSAPWTISYTTQQTQSFTLAVKIAGVEKSVSIAAPVVTSAPTEKPTTPTPTVGPNCEGDNGTKSEDCPKPPEPWSRLQIIGWSLSLAILALIAGVLISRRKQNGNAPPTQTDEEDTTEKEINNQFSNVVLQKIEGSNDSQPVIYINHEHENEVILGRSQPPPFNVDGTNPGTVGRQHCQIRRLEGGVVMIDCLDKWVKIVRTERNIKKTIVLPNQEGNTEAILSNDELHLSETSIYKVEVIQPSGTPSEPSDNPTKIDPIPSQGIEIVGAGDLDFNEGQPSQPQLTSEPPPLQPQEAKRENTPRSDSVE